MNKIKNLHYLYMFPKIETLFKGTVEKAEEGEVAEGFVKLRMCLEALEHELIKDNEWYKNRVSMKDRPTSEEVIKRLKIEKIITEKQADLFNSIRWLANKYVHFDRDNKKEKADLESLKNFCVRLDNELPSLMAHLGIGGASRFDYINKSSTETKRDNININCNNTGGSSSNNSFKNTSQNSTKGFSHKSKAQMEFDDALHKILDERKEKAKKEQEKRQKKTEFRNIFSNFFNNVKRVYNSNIVFLCRFVIVSIVFILLLSVVLNKGQSTVVDNVISDAAARSETIENMSFDRPIADSPYINYLVDVFKDTFLSDKK